MIPAKVLDGSNVAFLRLVGACTQPLPKVRNRPPQLTTDN